LITTILAFIVVLGILITIHEFGHFAMAKLLKIRVLVFSLGFPPKLVGFTHGGTEYRLGLIPLGGYVKMAGETFDSEREGAPDEFLSHPRWHRFLVAISGPFMNIFLAIAIFTFSFIQGVYEPRYLTEAPVLGPITANSLVDSAGMKTGDRILSVQGNSVKTWQDLEIALATAPKDSIEIQVARNNKQLDFILDASEIDLAIPDLLGFRFTRPKTVVGSISVDSPAHEAGLQAGDEILSVERNGKRSEGFNSIIHLISDSKEIPLVFEIFRPAKGVQYDVWQTPRTDVPGKILHLTITPKGNDYGWGVIGFDPDFPKAWEKYGFPEAVSQSIRHNYETAGITFQIIGRILTGSATIRNLSGPIEIAQISGKAARTGSARIFLEFLGLVSLQLGIFNLLPIPILDGGVILLLIIEGSIRRDLSINLKEKIVQAGFVFLILLMGFVVFNDLSKVIDFERIFG